jgi:transposase InsO family protein
LGRELPEEVRRHRRENNLCYGCGGAHQVKDCPKNRQTHAIQANTVSFDAQDGQLLMNPEPTEVTYQDEDSDDSTDRPLSYDPGESPKATETGPLWAQSVSWEAAPVVDLKAHAVTLRTDSLAQGPCPEVLRIERHPTIPTYECVVQLAHVKGFALVDCGATASFVAKNLVMTADPPLEQVCLPRPRQATMMAGQSGPITHYIMAQVQLDGRTINATHRFYVAPTISQHDIILGMDWIEATQPTFNYQDSTLDIKVPDTTNIRALVSQFQPSMLCSPDPVPDLETILTVCRVDLRSTEASPPQRGTQVLPPEYQEFADVFDERNADILPPHREHDHEIHLEPGSAPPHGRLYPLSQKEMEELRRYLDKMLANGFIRASKSPAAAPILFVPKKDGRLRPCVDYRHLNAITVKDKYPIPLISEHLDCLATAEIFTKLDLKGAYNLLRIAAGHEWKTAFRTRYGSFEYLVMPFGLCNAPSTFQRLMNHILGDLLDLSVVVYLDDILIFSRQTSDHARHVKEVLQRLRNNRLYCALEKCEFHTTEVEFLGYRISPGGIMMDPAKVQAVTDWPPPTSIRDIQVFLGFANFYRRFIRHYSRVAAPLTDRLRGGQAGKITLTAGETTAFQALKTAFTTAPVLRHFDPTLHTVVETDASDYVVAAVLSQWVAIDSSKPDDPPRPRTHRLHPIAYWSRKMQPAERNYEIHDKELLAIVDALQAWRHYLHGLHNDFEVVTDHQALQYFQTKRQLNRRQARWSQALGEFVFRIVYRPGALATRPDALSRRSDLHPNTDSTTTVADPANIGILLPPTLFAQTADIPLDESLVTATPESTTPMPVLPPPPDTNAVIRQFHDDPSAGHPGVAATLALLRRHYSWPTMRADVDAYVRTCSACQRAKHRRHKPYGFLLPLATPDRPFGSLSMDYIEGLPPAADTAAYNSILVVVDRLTKYAIFIPAHNTDSSQTLARLLHARVFSYFGLPDTIVSDRGRTFTSRLWTDILRIFGTTPALSTAYHPQTDGQTERMNQSLELFLRLYVNYQQDDWASWLPLAQLSINNRSSATTGLPPCLPVMGFTPRVHPDTPATGISGLCADADTFRTILDICKANIALAADRMSKAYNRSRMDRSFRRGDMVLLRTKHLRIDRPNRKLANPLAGPFKVDRPVGHRAYRLDLPTAWKIHPVFHVSLLEPYAAASRPSTHAPQAEHLEDDREEFEVEEIQDSRRVRRILQYLVKWRGYEAPTWEVETNVDGADELVQAFHRDNPSRPRRSKELVAADHPTGPP